MFTGLVEAVGVVQEVARRGDITRLLIVAPAWHTPALGESISVSGVCLTIVAASDATGGLLAFDAVPETLAKTTLGTLRPNSRVNLERSATPSTLLGGHLVQGHVDAVGRVICVQRSDDWRVRVEPPPALMEFMTPKGSVTIEGVSLTLAAVDPQAGWIEVALIPTTLDKTTLRDLNEGDGVNLEADATAKTIIHWLKHYAPRR